MVSFNDLQLCISSTVQISSWPEAKLAPNENKYLSVSIGRTSIHWAMHYIEENYTIEPHLFWRTPPILAEDVDEENEDILCQTLARYVPEEARKFLFAGELDACSVRAAMEQRQQRGHDVSVYIVSTNLTNLRHFSRMFLPIPSRLFLMKTSDFFTVSQGVYAEMAADRVAILRGAMVKYGTPALVFDVGSKFTYTAVDSDGYVLGGGVTLGLQARLDRIVKSNEDNNVHPLDIAIISEEILRGLKDSKDVFGKDLRSEILQGMFNEVTSGVKEVIQSWLSKNTDAKRKLPESNYSHNVMNHVIFTGGSGESVERLVNAGNEDSFKTKYICGLIHIGINVVLSEMQTIISTDMNHEESTNVKRLKVGMDPHRFVDERVAAYFPKVSDQLFRGTVTKVFQDHNGEHLYNILYDDGDEEDVKYEDKYAECGRDLKSKFHLFQANESNDKGIASL